MAESATCCLAELAPIRREAVQLAVDKVVKLFLLTAVEHGTLKEELEDAGYRRVRREWRRPAWLGVEQRSCLAAA